MASKSRVFIDGHAGTTGLRIREWLAGRDDLTIHTLDEAERKSEPARRKALEEADVSILCLPDAAAVEAGEWARACGARVIDASSAHRVTEDWVYGLPELCRGQREAIAEARLVSNPGCYPSAFLCLVRPLVDAGLLPADAPLAIHALSGYSGGGKALIERWESPEEGRVGLPYEAPYALDRIHKHVPEMQTHARLERPPFFVPAVGAFVAGMRVEVPLHEALLPEGADAAAVHEALASHHAGEPFVEVAPLPSEDAPIDDFSLDPRQLNGTNRLRLHVLPNRAGHLLLVGLLDNLGKGASGVAIQSLNLMLGLDERTGLPG